ncbi:bifunctional DNA primase/polymerase [Mesorhizobium sp. 10J20-29]
MHGHSLRHHIDRLCSLGLQVVRLRAGTKSAFEKSWPTLVRTADDFQPGDNIGVRFGPGSGNLIDVDLDYPTARGLVGCPAFGLDHLVEFGRASQPVGQRGHRLAIVPDSPNESRVFGIRSKEAAALMKARGLGLTIVEIRGSNGSQTAVPPSIIRQPSKKPDRLVWSNPDAEFPELSWGELNCRVGRLAFSALAAAVYPDNDRDAFCLSVFGVLVEAGVDLVTAEQMVCEVAGLAGDEAARDLVLEHHGEGLADFLALTRLQPLEPSIRSWLGVELADLMGSGQQLPDHDHAQGDVKSGQIDADTLRTLLEVLDPCDFGGYYDHLSILQASHHATGGSKPACEAVVAWSAQNSDFGPGKRDKSGNLWADIIRGAWKRSKVQRDGRVFTLGTLLHHVREAGHQDLANRVMIQAAFEPFEDPTAKTIEVVEYDAPVIDTVNWNANVEEK